jgi:hypothetical protein
VLRCGFTDDDYYEGIESHLCSIAQAEDDIGPYLRQWIETETLEACFALSGLILQSAVTLRRNAGRNAFWSGRDAQYQQLKDWVYSSAAAEKLENAALQWENTNAHDEFVAARSMLA